MTRMLVQLLKPVLLLISWNLIQAEQLNYSLAIENTMDPSWINYERDADSEKQCASMCIKNVENCIYFGYRDHECFLLRRDVDKDKCSIDDCTNSGMKIYKLNSDATAPAEITESAGEELHCETSDGKSFEISCSHPNDLLTAVASRGPFFLDTLHPGCITFKKKLYDDEEEGEVFFSTDGGLSMNAYCKNDDYVVIKYTMCVMDDHVQAIKLTCGRILDTSIMKEIKNVTSDARRHTRISCGRNSALQKIYMMDAGDGVATRVVHTCVELDTE